MSRETDQTSINQTLINPEAQPVEEIETRLQVTSPSTQSTENQVEVRRRSASGNSGLSEFFKFGIVAVILLGTPLVLSLLNPVIFGRIVPAILGTNLPDNTPTIPEAEVIQPAPIETPDTSLTAEPQTGIGGQATVTPAPPSPTPPSTATLEPQIHIVRSGETLGTIAGQYGLLAEDIAAANGILDPNQIFSGQELTIPNQSAQ